MSHREQGSAIAADTHKTSSPRKFEFCRKSFGACLLCQMAPILMKPLGIAIALSTLLMAPIWMEHLLSPDGGLVAIGGGKLTLEDVVGDGGDVQLPVGELDLLRLNHRVLLHLRMRRREQRRA